MDKETADQVRGIVRRSTLKNIKDDGQTQTASVEVADGIWRDDIEIHQPYGLISHAPEDGALAIVVAVGGDQGDLTALPIGNPSKRMGNTAKGTTGLANEHGDKVLILPDGTIEIAGGTALNVKIGGVTFRVSAEGVDITGGTVKHNGKDIGDTHKHGGVVHGSDNTDPPV